MKLRTEAGVKCRAKKDDMPKVDKGGRSWRDVWVTINEEEIPGLISQKWLYFTWEGQAYKLDTQEAEINLEEPINLETYELTPMTEEEKKAKKSARRKARREAKKQEAEGA